MRILSIKKSIFSIIIVLTMMIIFMLSVSADNIDYKNESTSYISRISDEAYLIDDADMESIQDAMKPITRYGNVGFYTTDYATSTTETLARSTYREWFGTDSGVLFIIDMDNRNIWIWSNGEINQTINKEWADIITDNTYRYASNGLYAECAKQTFNQINTRLEGGRVHNSLKIGTALLLSILLSLAVLLVILLRVNKKKMNPDIMLPLAGAAATFSIANTAKNHIRTTKTYTPSSSGGGGGFSGGGGGGGGFSGGGGGGSGGGHGF